ncbi:MAG: hypothetical protein ACI9EW_002533 [Cellvibrionaceae bacterium]|jgi:hypothetical protein
MSKFILMLIFVGLGLFVLFSFVLEWYRKKELQERRTLDLRILALENDAQFYERDQTFDAKLSRYNLAYKMGGIARNIRSKRFFGFTVYFFDFSYVGNGRSRSLEYVNGILIELDSYDFPRFHIAHKTIFSWLNLTGYAQVPKRFEPEWMPRTAFVFADRIDHDTVFNLLKERKELGMVIKSQDFEKVLFRAEYVAVYYRGLPPADLRHYQSQMIWAVKIARIFGISITELAGDGEATNTSEK